MRWFLFFGAVLWSLALCAALSGAALSGAAMSGAALSGAAMSGSGLDGVPSLKNTKPTPCPALHEHARIGAEDLLLLVLKTYAGCQVDALDAQSKTPLFYAVSAGNERVVRILAAYGAEPLSGAAPPLLHIAARLGRVRVFDLLTQLWGDTLLQVDAQGRLAWHHAAASGSLGVLKQLMADTQPLALNAQDHQGWAPLHYAAAHGRGRAARLLLQKGADAALRNNAGDTAYDLGWRHGHFKLGRIPALFPMP